jgi:L-fucono-1,5-lactonase
VRRIDAHQHFWRVERGDYHWMPDSGPLRRDYLPADLVPLSAAADIDGSVAVQAAQTTAETEWLLSLADDPASKMLGVVGWAPLDEPGHASLDALAAHPRGVGVRPMIQDLAEDDWIERRVDPHELQRVADLGLVFDLLALPRQLGPALRALTRVPDLVVVVDHLAKPSYRDAPGEWATAMSAFADRPNTYCKLSGLVTEIGAGWGAADFRQHSDIVLNAFGPDRLLFGSDWPVCLLAASHADVVRLAEELTAGLDQRERAAVFGDNAARVYGV